MSILLTGTINDEQRQRRAGGKAENDALRPAIGVFFQACRN
jgi:hypothetical protein